MDKYCPIAYKCGHKKSDSPARSPPCVFAGSGLTGIHGAAMPLCLENIPALATEISQKLMTELTASTSRKNFFSSLSALLRAHIAFDRLCINLYDQAGDMLIYFTAAQGTIASTLSPVRPAETSTTVAGRVIASRKPVIITDFSRDFPDGDPHPIAEAGLTATMAFPLILDDEIFATLHCSFARKPDHIYEYATLLLALSPPLATCLGAILSLEQVRRKGCLQCQPLIPPLESDDDIVCHSPAMREVMRKVDAVSGLHIPVLLLGETGTGKSLLAHAIHRRSPRKNSHFVKVNCPSLPQTLFESELFGHAKGSFTGAVSKRVGRFELAHGGTLFLDEIAELSPEMQSKFLQVLEDASFERVGESVSLAVDVRVLAATNVHPGDAVRRKKLRADLFYRLSPCSIELPPLRHRQEDIPPLVTALSAQVSATLGLPAFSFGNALLAPLTQYPWPGNVRELRNVLSKLLILRSMGKNLTTGLLEGVLKENSHTMGHGSENCPEPEAPLRPARKKDALPEGLAEERDETLAALEKEHILRVLRRTSGVLSGPRGAAAALGLPRSTLLHRMRKLGLR